MAVGLCSPVCLSCTIDTHLISTASIALKGFVEEEENHSTPHQHILAFLGWVEEGRKQVVTLEEEKQCAYRLIEGCTQNRLMRLETSQLCWKKNVDRSSSYYDPKSLTRDVQVEIGAKYRGGGGMKCLRISSI